MHIFTFEERMNMVLGRVAMRIRSDPPVVLDRGVQRHGSVRYIVTQPACEEGDLRLGWPGVLIRSDQCAVVPERALQTFVDFRGLVRLQADLLRCQGDVW